MTSKNVITAFLGAALLSLSGTSVGAETPRFSQQAKEETTEGLTKAVSLYIYPDLSKKLSLMLRKRHDQYLASGSPDSLASMLTDDLRSVSRDKHLTVWHSHDKWVRASELSMKNSEDETVEEAEGAGFSSLARLPGNIGYLNIKGFSGTTSARSLVDCYLSLLGYTNALIIDLRDNHGGSSNTVDVLTGYLLGQRELLVRTFLRQPNGNITKEDRYSIRPPMDRAYDRPVYILTSAETFSAAEEFTYDLKTHHRATVIGETTGGGAHPGAVIPIGPDFTAFIPIGRVEGSKTGTDWEGVGVTPDIPISSHLALITGYRMALADAKPTVHSERLDADLARAKANPSNALVSAFPSLH